MSSSLINFAASLVSGALVVAAIAIALTIISKNDVIIRKE